MLLLRQEVAPNRQDDHGQTAIMPEDMKSHKGVMELLESLEAAKPRRRVPNSPTGQVLSRRLTGQLRMEEETRFDRNIWSGQVQSSQGPV